MKTFNITFDFQGTSIQAGVTQIDPPPDRQWHIVVRDKALAEDVGEPFIICWSEKDQEYQYGISPTRGDMECKHSIALSLRDYLLKGEAQAWVQSV